MSARDPRDFYPTPPACFDAALDVLPWDLDGWTVLEPACGTGKILQVLHARGAIITASDAYEYDWSRWPFSVAISDFLARPVGRKFDLCVTNPPYSQALEFIKAGLVHADRVMMLLRLSMLGTKTRYPFWKSVPSPSLVVLSQRPSFTGGGSDNSEYAWFVWSAKDKDPIIPPIQWVMWR